MERNKLFGAQSRHWTPNENEFMAEDEIITIIPNFSSPIIHLLNVRRIYTKIYNII